MNRTRSGSLEVLVPQPLAGRVSAKTALFHSHRRRLSTGAPVCNRNRRHVGPRSRSLDRTAAVYSFAGSSVRRRRSHAIDDQTKNIPKAKAVLYSL